LQLRTDILLRLQKPAAAIAAAHAGAAGRELATAAASQLTALAELLSNHGLQRRS
jgi:hypothetical protein